MLEKKYLLDSKQMAQFATDGYLRFDDMVPDELNRAAYAEISTDGVPSAPGGTPFNDMWEDPVSYTHLTLPTRELV